MGLARANSRLERKEDVLEGRQSQPQTLQQVMLVAAAWGLG